MLIKSDLKLFQKLVMNIQIMLMAAKKRLISLVIPAINRFFGTHALEDPNSIVWHLIVYFNKFFIRRKSAYSVVKF